VSTDLYLECHSHNPVLKDGYEVGHNLDGDLDKLRGWLAARPRLVKLVADLNEFGIERYAEGHDSFNHALTFILEHPHCKIAIRDEYGVEHPLQPEPEADHEPPTRPSGLEANDISRTTISASWGASVDNVAVAYYEVLIDGEVVHSTTELSMPILHMPEPDEEVTGLLLQVVAVDTSGNRSRPGELPVPLPPPERP